LPTFIIFKDGEPYDRFVSWICILLLSYKLQFISYMIRLLL
jgi:hypothetical protein